MVLLFLSAFWILTTVLLIAGLCLAARSGDLQHDRPRTPVRLGGAADRTRLVSIPGAKHARHTRDAYPTS